MSAGTMRHTIRIDDDLWDRCRPAWGTAFPQLPKHCESKDHPSWTTINAKQAKYLGLFFPRTVSSSPVDKHWQNMA